VVHCSADELVMLAAWLVSGRGLSNKAAITAENGQKSHEAVIFAVIRGRNHLKLENSMYFNNCRQQLGVEYKTSTQAAMFREFETCIIVCQLVIENSFLLMTIDKTQQ